MEVAQIAKSIAIRINSTVAYFQKHPIDTDLVEFAGLAHDVGHPPFGHNGEAALDELMLDNGGYEGNAQTLRILTRIEKKVTGDYPYKSDVIVTVDPVNHKDVRAGLNISFRSVASILKYDREIPSTKRDREKSGTEKSPVKGYYSIDKDIVELTKHHVRHDAGEAFKTIECQIMDIADDIAYSTYDIEDSFKAEFLSPVMMFSMDKAFKQRIAAKVEAAINANYAHLSVDEKKFTADDVDSILFELFDEILLPPKANIDRMIKGVSVGELPFLVTAPTSYQSRLLGRNGYLRTQFTSDLVGQFVRDVEVSVNPDYPCCSKVSLSLETFKVVEMLKRFSFEALIESPRLKLAERRGKEIIGKLFTTLEKESALLPEDWRELYEGFANAGERKRVICDYIAGMTDEYCVEMYSRITGNNPISMWKPH